MKGYAFYIALLSKNLTSPIMDVKTILEQISDSELHLKLKKWSFACNKVLLLGNVLLKDGISVDSEKIRKISGAAILCCKMELQSFLGVALCYTTYVSVRSLQR